MRLVVALLIVSSVGAATEPAPVLASLERTGCFGTCPGYLLTVFVDGRVEWEGRTYVKVKGKRQGRLSATELEALKKVFLEAKYLDLGDGFDCFDRTDSPFVKTYFREGAREKRINHYHGCRSKPGVAALSALEDRFDAVVKSEQWAGTREERQSMVP